MTRCITTKPRSRWRGQSLLLYRHQNVDDHFGQQAAILLAGVLGKPYHKPSLKNVTRNMQHCGAGLVAPFLSLRL